MTLSDFFLMRHELLLIAAMLFILILDLNYERKEGLIPWAIALFSIITISGFAPANEGSIFGGMYVTDGLRIVMKNILNLGVLLVLFQSAGWLSKEDDTRTRIGEYYILLISSLIGVNYMISSGNFLMFYLGLELTTIPIAALAAYDRYKSQSAEAGIKLILSSAFSSAILLFGLSMIYGTAGSLDFANLTAFSPGNLLHVLGFIFFFAGLAFKITIVPFHLWTADVYEGSPVSITSYLSVVSKGSAIFILIILFYTIFNSLESIWREMVYVTAVLTMTIGNLFAIRQKSLKRLLAFSSIAQAGFIFLGVIGGSTLGMTSVIYFVLIYVFSNLAAFGVVSSISNATGKENVEDYNGLYRTNPRLSLTMMLALFSLAGIPPIAGFFGKFFLFAAAAEQGYYILVFIAVINAIIGLYYYLLVVKAMFINKNDQPIEKFSSDIYSKIGLVICVVGILVIGFASSIFDYINDLTFGL